MAILAGKRISILGRNFARTRIVESEPMSNTYITDIKHYLDEKGEMAEMPAPARKLASFLVLLIDQTASVGSVDFNDTGIRCRAKKCDGFILSRITEDGEEIVWHCPVCGHNGVIRNWQKTKWDQSKP